MASFCCAMASAANYIPSSSSSSSSSTKSPFSKMRSQNPVVKFSCKVKIDENIPRKNLDRRDILLGLGGLYSTTLVENPLAFAKPANPAYRDCIDATEPNGTPINCCPPATSRIIDYVPSATSDLRTRKPAQSFTVDSDYYMKYVNAIQKMKNLSLSDPRNFSQQANVHCAYCDGGYTQQGYPKLLYEIHNSWMFFPFHRWYLYFFEKICANLIDDDSFVLPFWNWDDPSGMKIPDIFNVTTSPLYDCNRNPQHLPPSVIDLEWSDGDPTINPKDQIEYNLRTMYRQMVTQSKTPRDFYGGAYRAGDDLPTEAGSIEQTPHNNVHSWTGTNTDLNNPVDMGTFYSAARDPIFYAHHTNVDRMWTIWRDKLGGRYLTDPDWLDATFIFYNEEAKPVRVKVRDCLDTKKLGYAYEDVPLRWLDAKPSPRTKRKTLPSIPEPTPIFPIILNKKINVIVKRPIKLGTGSTEEILVIQGIEFDKAKYVKFNVYINEDDVDVCRPDNTEFLGSFSHVPHGHQMGVKENKRFRISEVLEELGALDNDSVLVTLVPRSDPVRINGIKIEFDTE